MIFRAAPLLLLAAACAVTPDEIAGVRISIAGVEQASERDMAFSAHREFDSFAIHRRAADLLDARYVMERYLREEGYAHAEVDLILLPSTEKFDRAAFAVREGPRTFMGRVTFPGAEFFPQSRLREFFDFEGSGLLDLGDAVFVQSRVDSAAGEVETLYLREGFFDVRVGPAQVSWREDRTVADVVVPVVEGRRYFIREVEIDDDGTLARRFRTRILHFLKDEPFYVRRPAEAASRVRGRLLEQGHQRAQVDSSYEVDREAAAARVVVRVRPGPLVRLDDVRIQGYDRTEADFLRRRIPLERGDLLEQDRIDRAFDRIYGSGLFRMVRTTTVQHRGEEQDAVADLLVEVEELLARSVSFQVGWGSYELARGAVRYEDRNLFGRGRRLNAELQASLRSYGGSVSLADDYVLGRRNTLRLGAGWNQREEPTFTRTLATFDASVARRFRGPYTGTFGYLFESERASDIEGEIPAVDDTGFFASAGFFLRGRRDTRDDRLIPTTGTLTQAGVFWSSPLFGADLDYLELSGGFAFFRPLFTDRIVLAAGFRFATREILNDDPTLPIQRRFFTGGDSTVRSFGEDELGPVDAMGTAIGGLTEFVATVELRVRVAGQLHTALFYDVGTIGEDSFDVHGPYGHAIGLGVRYYLPVGPVRLDFGYNPGERFAADDSWALHFAFGFTF